MMTNRTPQAPPTSLDALRRSLRASTATATSDDWRPLYQAALVKAHQDRKFSDLAEIALLAAGRLEVQGQFAECLAQLDYAIRMASEDAATAVHLTCVRAGFAAVGGEMPEARRLIEAARASLPEAPSPKTRLEFETHSAVVECIGLANAEPGELSRSLPATERKRMDWLASALKTWLAPWLVATGRKAAALPVIDSLESQARATGHQWRIDDATVFRAELDSAFEGRDRGLETVAASLNRNARFRGATTGVWVQLLRGNTEEARRLAATANTLGKEMPPPYAESARALGAFAGASALDGEVVDLEAPATVTLCNLPLVLAGAEAMAIGGSQAAASQWLRAVNSIPRHIGTSLEWPTSTHRVRGLLLLRTGSDRAGIVALRQAIRWADEHGYRIEAGVARVQAAEAIALVGTTRGVSGLEDYRSSGRELLRDAGLDPVVHAYLCDQVIAMGRAARLEPKLTEREVEVLGALAEGLTYREVAARLGIEWRTVRAHSHHIYSKLGASGKVRAIAAARERRIL